MFDGPSSRETSDSGLTSPPRGPAGLVLIGLFLGPGALMLWLGRGKAAIAYTVASLIFFPIFLALAGRSETAVALLAGLDASWLFKLVPLPVAVIGLIHAFRTRQAAMARPWFSRWYVSLPLIPILTIAAALGVRTFLYQPFHAPAQSMTPGLMQGDYFFVDKRAYGYGPYSLPAGLGPTSGRTRPERPERGDIVVFRLPANPAVDYIKRVVGLPGDRIRVSGGVLWINETPVQLEPATLEPSLERAFELDGAPRLFRETLPNGRSYIIASIQDEGIQDDTDTYVVPEGHYFTMGDNRDNSQDSRYLDAVGYIPEENLIGPVVLRFWNSMGFPLGGRPEETYPAQ